MLEAHTIERRRSYRVPVTNAHARCAHAGFVGHYTVADLSMGGALLRGTPSLPEGTRLEVLLVLPEHGTVLVEGHVLRVTGGDPPWLVVQFSRLTATDEDIIEDTIAGEFVRAYDPAALIADSTATGEELSWVLRHAGLRALRVTTPLEVIHYLERTDHRVHTVVLGRRVGAARGLEFASFLADAYPRVRRVLIDDDGLVAASPDPSRPLVHAVLHRPWSEKVVRRVLGAAPPPRE